MYHREGMRVRVKRTWRWTMIINTIRRARGYTSKIFIITRGRTLHNEGPTPCRGGMPHTSSRYVANS